MKKHALILVTVLLFGLPAFAGVVYEIEMTEHTKDPPAVGNGTISVDGVLLKMDMTSSGGDMDGEMIYRGDRREMVIINDKDRTYFVIDQEQMRALAAQMGEAMAAMEQALAAVPEAQRAQIEEMMKKRMPLQATPREPHELKKTGDSETINGYPCVRYEVWRGGVRERELWVTSWDNIEGGSDTAQAFEDMADFFTEMLESIPMMDDRSFGDLAFGYPKELGGIPLITREFAADGSLVSQTALKSASRRAIDATEFEPPTGYKRKDMFKEAKKGKRGKKR